jgi:hypothetical protein
VNAHLQDTGDHIVRLLEIIEVMSGDDGELYASSVRRFLMSIDGDSDSQGARKVLELAVERVLTCIRESKPMISGRLICLSLV